MHIHTPLIFLSKAQIIERGTALGVDYTLSSTTITIAAGQLSGTATVTAAQDALDEAGESEAAERIYRRAYDLGDSHSAWNLAVMLIGQGREAAERLAQVAQSLQDSLAGLQQAMAQEVLQLACDIARQVVRREVAGNPRAMLPVVREALGMLAAEIGRAHV